jgi:S-(hydroxymethyl)glutathione dehydrogenase/alcohol dehydrogenase
MRMKAAVMHTPRQPLVIEDVELDAPHAGEVLVKMVASGVCHSDVHNYTGDLPVPPPPIVLGHEGGGIVQEVGPGVTRLKPGDKVVMTFLPSCGRCRWCHTGQPNLCDLGAGISTGKMLDGTNRMRRADGTPLNSWSFISTYAEYSVAPEASLVKVPEWTPLEKACLFGCGFTTGYGAVTNAIRMKPGETITIVGCGGLGLAAIQGAAASDAGKIIAVDVHEEKLEMAKKMGATHAVRNRHKVDEAVKEIMDITWGLGTDYSGDFVGFDQCNETIDLAFKAVRKGGTMLLVGVAPLMQQTMPVNPALMTLFQKTIKGLLFGSAQFQVDIPRYIDLMHAGKIDMDSMVTHEYKLTDINTCFANLLAGNKVARQVIRFP